MLYINIYILLSSFSIHSMILVVLFKFSHSVIFRSKFEFLLNKNIWKKPLGCIINKMK